MPDRIYLVFCRHTNYTANYDGVNVTLFGVFEDADVAYGVMTDMAEKEMDRLKEVFTDEELYHSIDVEERYCEILAGDDVKYEYFIMDCEPDATFVQEIS